MLRLVKCKSGTMYKRVKKTYCIVERLFVIPRIIIRVLVVREIIA